MTIGNVTDKKVRRLRERLDLSQERFAHLLGVSLQTVRRWEAGVSKPLPIISLRLSELERESRGLGMPTEDSPLAAGRETVTPAEPAKKADFGLGGLFKGIGSLLDLVSKMAEEGQGETRYGEAEALGGRAKAVYGISIRLGLGGEPVIEQFGNIKATETGTEVAEVREPLVDVIDEGDRLVVIAELPGVEDADIQVDIKDDILFLSATGNHRSYSKEVLLPVPVEAAALEKSYRNGIMELRLVKRA